MDGRLQQLFRVTRTVGPDRTAIDVGTPADDLLYDLRGFHAPERDQDPARGTFRWTGPRASLTLPGGRDVTLVVAGGRPPGTPLHLAAAPPKNHSKHGVLSRFVPHPKTFGRPQTTRSAVHYVTEFPRIEVVSYPVGTQ